MTLNFGLGSQIPSVLCGLVTSSTIGGLEKP